MPNGSLGVYFTKSILTPGRTRWLFARGFYFIFGTRLIFATGYYLVLHSTQINTFTNPRIQFTKIHTKIHNCHKKFFKMAHKGHTKAFHENHSKVTKNSTQKSDMTQKCEKTLPLPFEQWGVIESNPTMFSLIYRSDASYL